MSQLTQTQVQLVLRRAAELEQKKVRSRDEALTPAAEVAEIAREVGLSEDAVTRALVEVRAGAGGAVEKSRLDRVVGPAVVSLERMVTGDAREIGRRIEAFMVDQTMTVKRHHGDRVEWCHARGVWPGLQRTFDLSGRCAIPKGMTVETAALDLGDGRTMVKIALHAHELQNTRAARGAAGAAVGATLIALGLWNGGVVVPIEMLALGGGATTAVGSLVHARRAYRRSIKTAEASVERFLDALEHGR